MKEKVREKFRVSKKWVALALPALLFLLLSVSHVLSQSNSQIIAQVFVRPATKVSCSPETLIVGSSVTWINCIITIDNADVHNINPSSVTLGLLPAQSGCNVLNDLNTFNVIDSHNAFVRFSRSTADSNCFLPLPANPTFTVSISGTVGGFQFSATTPLNYIRTCQDAHVHSFQANTTAGSGTILALNAPNFDLSKYSARTYSLNGFFDCRNNKIIGDMKFFTTGTINEPIIINWIPSYLNKLFVKKIPVQISVIFSTLDNCFADSTSHMECSGKGTIFIDKEQPFQRTRIDVSNIFVEVNGRNATVKAGQVFNDVLDVENLFVSKVTIKPSIPKI